MHFDLVDSILEQTGDRIVTLKHVTNGEEYLQDHFAGYPVLPGVMMLEAMVQAGRTLAGKRTEPLVLGQVRALKYGAFVRPGHSLRVEVDLHKRLPDGSVEFRGEAVLVDPPGTERADAPRTAVSGRFTLRPLRR